jgi:hypothetical protein
MRERETGPGLMLFALHVSDATLQVGPHTINWGLDDILFDEIDVPNAAFHIRTSLREQASSEFLPFAF